MTLKIMMDYDNVMNFQNNVRYATNKHHRKCYASSNGRDDLRLGCSAVFYKADKP